MVISCPSISSEENPNILSAARLTKSILLCALMVTIASDADSAKARKGASLSRTDVSSAIEDIVTRHARQEEPGPGKCMCGTARRTLGQGVRLNGDLPRGFLWSAEQNALASVSPRPSFSGIAAASSGPSGALWRHRGGFSVSTDFKVYQQRVEKSKFDDVLSAS
jgi:hypothetical protein